MALAPLLHSVIVFQMLELSGNACRDNKRQRLIPRHIVLAMKNDEELNQFCARVTCPGGGVLPFVHPVRSQSTLCIFYLWIFDHNV